MATLTFSLQVKEFKDALLRCSSIIPSTPQPEILGLARISFSAAMKIAKIEATDGRVTGTSIIPLRTCPDPFDKDVVVLIDPKKVAAVIPAIKTDELILCCIPEEAKVDIKGSGHTFGFVNQLADGYPSFASPNKEANIKIPSNLLKKCLSAVAPGVNKNSTIPCFTGVHMEYEVTPESRRLYFVALNDQYGLFSAATMDLGDENFIALIPHYALGAITKVIEEAEDVRIRFNERNIRDENGEVVRSVSQVFFQSRRGEVSYVPLPPDTEFPTSWDTDFFPGGVKKLTFGEENQQEITRYAINAEKLRDYLNIAKGLSGKEDRAVSFIFEPDADGIKGTLKVNAESDGGFAKMAPIEVGILSGGSKTMRDKITANNLSDVLGSLTGNDIIVTRNTTIRSEDQATISRFDSGNQGDISIGGIVAPLKDPTNI